MNSSLQNETGLPKETLLFVRKRNGELANFNADKITSAIMLAMDKVGAIDQAAAKRIASKIAHVEEECLDVERIQDLVIEGLFIEGCRAAGTEYIMTRQIKEIERNIRAKEGIMKTKLLSEEFISRYKKLVPPMTDLGHFVYFRTYSRWIDELSRREFWFETVARSVEYICSLVPNTSKEEAERLFDNIFNLRQFLSGRTFWIGGTKVSTEFPMANYNCSFLIQDQFKRLKETFYLLMIGSGVGFRNLPSDVAQLPPVRQNVKLLHKPFEPVAKNQRNEYSELRFDNDGTTANLIIGDSREAWAESLGMFFDLLSDSIYKRIKTIVINYDNVRPEGERLKTFGGSASGFQSLEQMYTSITRIIQDRFDPSLKPIVGGKLRPIHIYDICNIIAQNVKVGGVRRSSLICLFDHTDEEMLNAKRNWNFLAENNLMHRTNSNNSIFFETKPNKEFLYEVFKVLREMGDPGFANAVAARHRRADYQGGNPCFEVLLSYIGLCNLVTANCTSFVTLDGKFDVSRAIEVQSLNARSSYRLTTVKLEKDEWDRQQQKDKLLGVSLTGFKDAIGLLRTSVTEIVESIPEKAMREMLSTLTFDDKAQTYRFDLPENFTGDYYERPEFVNKDIETIRGTFLNKFMEGELTVESIILLILRYSARISAFKYADKLGMSRSLLVTTMKPEGTLSNLPTVSSGIHWGYARYYVRRVRVNKHDALVKVCEHLGYPVLQDPVDETLKIIEFPCESFGETRKDVSAIRQLENYKMFMRFYVDHNASCTIDVRSHEWDEVVDWVYDNWDIFVGVSFLSVDETRHPLMPFEEITEEDFNLRKASMKHFNPNLISQFENKTNLISDANLESSCDTGACPVR